MAHSMVGTRRSGRFVAAIVLAAYAALSLYLFQDVMNPTQAGYQVTPVRTHRLVDVAASIGRARGVNPIIATAAVETGGEGVALELPTGFGELLAREPDTFTGGVTPTINKGLIDPFLGGRVSEAEYDPVLDAAQAAALDGDPDLVEYPMDLWALPSQSGSPVVRFYTDPTRMRIYILAEDLVPEAGR